jgi:hypothetical protein
MAPATVAVSAVAASAAFVMTAAVVLMLPAGILRFRSAAPTPSQTTADLFAANRATLRFRKTLFLEKDLLARIKNKLRTTIFTGE